MLDDNDIKKIKSAKEELNLTCTEFVLQPTDALKERGNVE